MKSYQEVYKILASESDYLSGEKIAEVLNLSRTSVWKAIQRLQQEGLEIDSIKNRGYKLLHGDLILPQEIENNINLSPNQPRVMPRRLWKLVPKEIHSTFQLAKRWAVVDFNAPTTLQTKGESICLSTSNPISFI